MTTKEMERKALAQIKKIVESLGEDSYVGTAFEGCFEIAEQNIENDFACSMAQRAESAEKKLETVTERYEKTLDSYKNNMNLLNAEKEEAIRKMQNANAEAQSQANRAAKAEEELYGMHAEWMEERKEVETIQKENDKLMDEIKVLKADYEDEIIRLKAKLYDLMVK